MTDMKASGGTAACTGRGSRSWPTGMSTTAPGRTTRQRATALRYTSTWHLVYGVDSDIDE